MQEEDRGGGMRGWGPANGSSRLGHPPGFRSGASSAPALSDGCGHKADVDRDLPPGMSLGPLLTV